MSGRGRTLPASLMLTAALAVAACHPGPVLNTGTELQAGGTIAGIVSATGGTVALSGRQVTATNTATGATFQAITGVTGGYTLKVPVGTYRIAVALRPGETVAKGPAETRVDNGDIDASRDFEVTAAPAP